MNREQMVRAILLKCGKNPPAGLDTGKRSELGIAEEVLDQVSREVQVAHRWAFSDRLKQEITPDSNGKLAVPAGTVFIESDDRDSDLELVQVGEFLYDRGNQTDVFENVTRVRINLIYKPECLPMHIRQAVVDVAASEFAFQRSDIDSKCAEKYPVLKRNADRSLAEAQRRDMDSKRVNVLRNDPAFMPDGVYGHPASDNSRDLYWNGWDMERR